LEGLRVGGANVEDPIKIILEGTTLMMGTFTVKGTKEVVDSA